MRRLSPLAAMTSGLLLLQATADAAITSQVNIDFQGIPAAVYGAANLALVSPGLCAGAGNCYFEDGMIVGVVDDPVGIGEHVHRGGPTTDRTLLYHADSSGPYFRTDDGSAFAVTSLTFNAPISIDNPDTGPAEQWEILGFSDAANPGLSSGDGTNYANRVAYQTVANGFSGTVTLNAGFNNVKAIWIHYKGYPGVPNAKDFAMAMDNLAVGPAALPPDPNPSAKKVPAMGPATAALLFLMLAAIGGWRQRLARNPRPLR